MDKLFFLGWEQGMLYKADTVFVLLKNLMWIFLKNGNIGYLDIEFMAYVKNIFYF